MLTTLCSAWWRTLAPLSLSLVLIAATGASGPVGATDAFESLNQPQTASQTALGGLSPVGRGGPAMIRANPAGLVGSGLYELGLGHRSWQRGLRQEWAGAAVSAGRFVVGAEAAALHAGELPAFDAQGREQGSFRPIELILGLGAATGIGDALSTGASLHYLQLESPGGGLQGVAADVGLSARIGRTQFGLSVRNLGPELEGEVGSYRLPRSVLVGIEHAVSSRASLGVVGEEGLDGEWRLQASGRWIPRSTLTLLLGSSYEPDRIPSRFVPSLGAEVAVGRLDVSYGFASDGDLGNIHHLSVGLRASHQSDLSVNERFSLGEPAVPEPVRPASESPPRVPPAEWSVWMGIHRSQTAADAEIRALHAEGFRDATSVPMPNGTFRIRVAAHLTEPEARALAHRIRGACTRD